MKQAILIIFIFLSYSLQTMANQEVKKTNIEVGASIGLFTGSGVSLRFNLVKDFSLKLSGFVLNDEFDENLVYEARTSLVYSLYENEIFELYVINSLFKTNVVIIRPNTKKEATGYAPGFGLKIKLKESLPFFIKPQNDNNISLFAELQENITNIGINVRKIQLEPNVNIGILFDF